MAIASRLTKKTTSTLQKTNMIHGLLGDGFKICLFSPQTLGKWSNLTSIFFKGVGSTTNEFSHVRFRGGVFPSSKTFNCKLTSLYFFWTPPWSWNKPFIWVQRWYCFPYKSSEFRVDSSNVMWKDWAVSKISTYQHTFAKKTHRVS